VSLPQNLGGWTFVVGAGTSAEAVIGAGPQVAVPFERLQLQLPVTGINAVDKALGVIGSTVNRFVDRVISATQGSRSIPFGAGGTVCLAVNFTNGQKITIGHRLGTSAVSILFGCPTTGALASGTFSADANNIYITPSATWIGDVFLLIHA
jgi:hypothetical protein